MAQGEDGHCSSRTLDVNPKELKKAVIAIYQNLSGREAVVFDKNSDTFTSAGNSVAMKKMKSIESYDGCVVVGI